MALATEEELPANRRRTVTLGRWPVWLLAGAAGLNLIVLLVQLRGFINGLYRNPDIAFSEVLTALSGSAGPGHVVVLGSHPFYEAWWLEKATVGLPHHWQVWEGIPFVIAFLGIALMAWAAWRVLGVFAALLTTTVMVALGDAMRLILFSSDAHGYVVAHGALIAATVVFLAERAIRGRLSWLLLAGVGVALTVLNAVAATDPLFEFAFLPSLAVAGCVVWWRHPGYAQMQLAVFCVAVSGASVVGAQLLDVLMRSEHVVASAFPITFVLSNAIVAKLQTTIVSVTGLGGGEFFSRPVAGTSLLVFTVGVLAIVGLLAVLGLVWRYAKSLDRRSSRMTSPQDIYIVFWMGVVVLSLAAYVLTSVGIEGANRYLPGVYAGSAALLPVLAGRRVLQRALLAGAVTLFACLIATNHLIEGPLIGSGPSRSDAYKMLEFVHAQHADHGYSTYEVAPVATFQTHAALKVYPIFVCNGTVFPGALSEINTWYRPKAGTRSFIVTQSGTPFATNPPQFGAPLAGESFGPYSVYVYRYDVATKLGGTC
ncbi:MAG TPA: hypothetical protein VIH71_13060 [Solirubrobacteraceae bacterium]